MHLYNSGHCARFIWGRVIEILNEHATHPALSQLTQFARGELGLDEIEEIRQHLATCDSCCEALEEIPDDTLLSLVRRSDTFLGPNGKEYAPNPPPTFETNSKVQDRTTFPPDEAVTCVIPEDLVDHPRYRILARIGKGGMGDVYKAEHRLMQRIVALKVINHVFVNNPRAIERFRREVQAAASLTHPNIVSAYDADQAGKVHFLAMEYVEGTDLAGIVKRSGPMAVEEACRLVRQAAIGLDHAHQCGMIHRDIKPHNLMLADDGTVKILDFGLASLSAEPLGETEQAVPSHRNLTTYSTVIGTPDYVSPEQVEDAHKVDSRADIYSLGATLYYLLAGRPPFEAASINQWLDGHGRPDPMPIEDSRPNLPDGLVAVIRRMMALAPDQRYERAMDVAKVLEPFSDQDTRKGEAARLATKGLARQQEAPKSRPWQIVAPVLAVACLALTGLLIVNGIVSREADKTTDSSAIAAMSESKTEPKASPAPTSPQSEYQTVRVVAEEPVTASLDYEFAFDFRGSRFDRRVFVQMGINSLYGASLIKPESRGLRITIPKEQIATKQQLAFAPALEIQGDFDITASYEILMPADRKKHPGTGPSLYLASQSYRYSASLTRTKWNSEPVYWLHWKSTDKSDQPSLGDRFLLAEGHTGRLRFVRAGTVLHFLAAEGDSNEYLELGTTEFGAASIGLFRLAACVEHATDTVDIVWQDLTIRAEGFKDVSGPVSLNEEQPIP